MKFQVNLLRGDFIDSRLMSIFLGKLLLYLTNTLKFSKFQLVSAVLFCWFQGDKLEWRTYQMDYCANKKNYKFVFLWQPTTSLKMKSSPCRFYVKHVKVNMLKFEISLILATSFSHNIL